MHDANDHYFKANVDNNCAYLAYVNLGGDTIDLYRTFVPESLRGMGIAAQLTQAALDYAEKNDLKVIPSCSYVEKYMQSKKLI